MHLLKKGFICAVTCMMCANYVVPVYANENSESDISVNYVYLENTDVISGDEVVIATSLSEEAKNVSVQIQNGDEIISVTPSLEVENLYKFTPVFDENGEYSIQSITADDQIIYLDEIGIHADFSVGDEIVSEPANYSNGQSDVVVVDEDSVTTLEAALSNAGVENVNSKLTICIDPGHGGHDSGAGAAQYGVYEKDLNLRIALKLRDYLEGIGVKVVMTRTTDVFVGSETVNDLEARAIIAAENNADILISCHLNAVNGSATGAMVFYPNDHYKPELAPIGGLVSEGILDELAKLGIANRGIKIRTIEGADEGWRYPDESDADYYGIIRHAKYRGIPGIIIEHCFIDAAADYYNFLNTDQKIQNLAYADFQGIVRAFHLSEENGWKYYGVRWHYYENNVPVTGWKKINGVQYYFDEDGNMAVNAQEIDGKTYYFDVNGVLQQNGGWHKQGNHWYYIDENGNAAIGWTTVGGTLYYFDKEGSMATGWQEIDGKTYFFDNSGKKRTGWLSYTGNWYLFDDEMKIGFAKYSGETYYFNKKGIMQTGWVLDQGTWYYFDGRGAMKTGWLLDGGTWYYLKEDGAMVTGVYVIDGVAHHFNGGGAWLGTTTVQTGWKKEGNHWYYYKEDGSLATGWLEDGSNKYYMNASGVMQTGWVLVNNTWYYFEGSGAMKTGWLLDGSTWYYLKEDGVMVTGTHIIDGTAHHFNGGGAWLGATVKKVGWHLENGVWHFYKEDGSLATGWLEDGSNKYYMNANGAMQTGWVLVNNKWYYFEGSGAMKTGWLLDGSTWYYLKEDGEMATGWVQVGSDWYFMNTSGAMQTGWLDSFGTWYYLNGSGVMVTGTYIVDGVSHKFSESGAWLGRTSDLEPQNSSNSASGYAIMGTSEVTVTQLVNYYMAKRGYYDVYSESQYNGVLADGGAPTIQDYCQMYYEEAMAEGVRVEVAFVQAMCETGYLQYGGDVKPNQYNFAGLGATGGVPGNVFTDVRTGIRAQIQHLKCYASDQPLNNPCVDQRWWDALRLKAPTVEQLSGTWAASTTYSNTLLNMIQELKGY